MSYSGKVYRNQGGDTLTVASGGTISVESGGVFTRAGSETIASGGTLTVASGAAVTVASGATLTVAGSETISSGGSLTLAAGSSLIDGVTLASGDGTISVKSGLVVITKGSAAALVLNDPTADTDDGKRLTIIAATAHAHTVSNAAGSGFNGGGAGADVGTFGGAKGDGLTVRAYQGDWYIETKTNVTLG